jgi:uncharacterized membrane protein
VQLLFSVFEGFFYAPYLPVHGHGGTYDQLIILAIVGWVGVISFCIVPIKKL